MSTETDKVKHDMMTYGSGFMKDGKHIPLSDIYIAPPIELNQEHVQLWQNCYFDNPPGDLWLINLFANEYRYLKQCDCDNGCPDCSTSLIDFSC